MISPCRGICRVDWQLHYCRDCLRTLAEITAWRDLNDDERLFTIKELELRDEDFFRNQCRLP